MVMLVQTAGAFLAVASFSMILELPRRFMAYYGTAGAVCWLVYLISGDATGSKILGAFWASLAVAVSAHVSARILKAPVTVFLIPGILPLVPGASIYNSVYHMIQNSPSQATYYLVETLQFAGAIAMAVFLVDSMFHLFRRKGKFKAGTENKNSP